MNKRDGVHEISLSTAIVCSFEILMYEFYYVASLWRVPNNGKECDFMKNLLRWNSKCVGILKFESILNVSLIIWVELDVIHGENITFKYFKYVITLITDVQHKSYN